MTEYVLIIEDKMFPGGDCKVFGVNLNKLKAEAKENLELDPENITACIYSLCKGEISDLICDFK
jgi:hypothetical protein